MDVINKLYSSVSSTVSQLSGVLPGNPVTREFEASEHVASAGAGKPRVQLLKSPIPLMISHLFPISRPPVEDLSRIQKVHETRGLDLRVREATAGEVVQR